MTLTILIVGGLLLCGAPHQALHHADGALSCAGCGLTGIEAPPPVRSCGLPAIVVRETTAPELAVPHPTLPLAHAPRAPPSAA